MIKGILMDLGKTIVTNENFSFQNGLKAIYKQFKCINNAASLNIFLTTCSEYMYLYSERDKTNIEIPFSNYITHIFKKLKIINYNILDIEYHFLINAMTDNLIPNVLEFLTFINSLNIPIIIVSNSTFSAQALYAELKALNINNCFKEIISSSDVLYRKPCREIFDIAYERMLKYSPNALRSEILFIGNDYNLDALGSHNAGLRPIFLNHDNISNDLNIYSFNNYLSLIDEIKKNI